MIQHSVEDYQTVRAGRRDLSEQWGGDPIAEDPDKLQVLERFCEFMGEDPDTIIGRCFGVRKSDGERVLSNKWRAHYAQKVEEFRDRSPDRDGRSIAAGVLSFLIHNRVMLQV